jgi:hypothetical protein
MIKPHDPLGMNMLRAAPFDEHPFSALGAAHLKCEDNIDSGYHYQGADAPNE